MQRESKTCDLCITADNEDGYDNGNVRKITSSKLPSPYSFFQYFVTDKFCNFHRLFLHSFIN